jgi:alkylation response protein AidB-like acyl-CoA dehydrogenase
VQVPGGPGLCDAGADGYLTAHPAARALRDAAGLSLAGGTDELMLQQIDRG